MEILHIFIQNPHFATYYINGSQVTYSQYLSQFTLALQREMRILIPVDAPQDLYVFGYTTPGLGLRVVVEDYALGDLVEDYIYDSSVGTLDEHNGKFAVTPEYPNGTYAYFMTEDSSGNPAYPYAIGPTFMVLLYLKEILFLHLLKSSQQKQRVM